MEFYLYNKDDRKSSTLVNLATTFKLNDINYIVYYNTEVEKSVIDIYIGKISYGDQCLVINKIDSDKQGDFLNIIKSILASNAPETEFGDYDNIIDTATIVLESVQKIQIPTTSLDILKKYHSKELDKESTLEPNIELTDENNVNVEDEEALKTQNNSSEMVKEQELENQISQTLENNQTAVETENNQNEDNSNSDSFIHSDDKLSSLDNLLSEKSNKEKVKKKKIISAPILILLIIVIIGAIILYVVGDNIG